GGAAQFVDEYAVRLLNRTRPEGRHVGLDPDTDDSEVAVHAAAARSHSGLDPLFAFEPHELLVAQKLDAVLLVDRGGGAAPLWSHDPLERHLPTEDRRHMDPKLRQRGSHLAADEAH